MESALIVSNTEKSISFFMEMLKAISCEHITTVHTCGEARRLLLDRDFDLFLINAPLQDESGEELALYIVEKSASQVILVVKTELYDDVTARVEDAGVSTVAKPINRSIFWSALKLAGATHTRMRKIRTENKKLIRKIEDIKVVDRAKYLLISYLSMTEAEAHRYIERQAMDARMTKRAVAERILKTYES
jgi:response regulator NasT